MSVDGIEPRRAELYGPCALQWHRANRRRFADRELEHLVRGMFEENYSRSVTDRRSDQRLFCQSGDIRMDDHRDRACASHDSWSRVSTAASACKKAAAPRRILRPGKAAFPTPDCSLASER